MWFLSTNPEEAAAAVCDQDVLLEVRSAAAILKTPKHTRWVANYYHRLLDRLTELPKPLKAHFTYGILELSQGPIVPTASVVATNRVDYVTSRHSYAEWSTSSCPGWFFRLANTILDERSRENFLYRVEPAGPSGPDDSRGRCVERKDVRDGPVAEISGDDGHKFLLDGGEGVSKGTS